jgi:hypothetical protein
MYAISAKEKAAINFFCGLFTGAFCAGFFNPWDRALYLSVKFDRPFLNKLNFTNMFHGASQAMVQRSIFGGVYFVVQGQLRTNLYPVLSQQLQFSESTSQLTVGAVAGTVNGIVTNPMSAVKYHTWGNENRAFLSSCYQMYKGGGVKPFLNGMFPTILRDITFGCIYEVGRHQIRSRMGDHLQYQLLGDMTAAGLSTVLAGPFNYARNIQFQTPPDQKQLSVPSILNNLWRESQELHPTIRSKLSFFQRRFRVGWGTARVAVGMAVGQQVFDRLRNGMTKYIENDCTKPTMRR